MKHPITRIFTMILAAAMLTTSAAAQTDTTFTYQGSLNDASSPANGDYSLHFLLFDELTGGTQIGSSFVVASQTVADGLFTTKLDFGANAFDNTGRWLEIVVDGTTLSPRQPITRTPYSIQTRGINVADNGFVGIGRNDELTGNEVFGIHRPGSTFGGMYSSTDAGGLPFYGYSTGDKSAYHYLDGTTGDWKLYVDDVRMTVTDDGKVGIGTTTPAYQLHVAASSGHAIYGYASAATGFTRGVNGKANSITGIGVRGDASALSGVTYGVLGTNESSSGRGVYGEANSSTGTTYGVYGYNRSTSGRGVYGRATASTGTAYGVYGESQSASGRGVYGEATSLTGATYGVYGYNRSTLGRGVFGWTTAITGTTYGVYGESQSTSGRGVYGQASALSGTTYGVYGVSLSQSGYGVYGYSGASTGIAYGIFGMSDSISGRGMFGYATSSTGVNYGVIGRSDSVSGFDFYAGGAGVNYGATSSRRWKNNIVNIDNPLDKLAQLRGVYFDWDKDHGGTRDIGMIAEEVGMVLPEIVNYEVNGDDAIGMDYSKMTPLLVEALNALRAEKDTEIAELRNEIANLKGLVERLVFAQQNEDSQ